MPLVHSCASESWGRGGPPCSVSGSFLVMGITGTGLLSGFLLVKLVDFSGSVTFRHSVLSCYDDNPLIVHLYDNLRGYKKAK